METQANYMQSGNIDYNLGVITTTTTFNTVDTVFRYDPLTYYSVYPYWNTYYSGPNKLEQAFNIVKVLIEKEVISEPKTVGDFIELVNNIKEVL